MYIFNQCKKDLNSKNNLVVINCFLKWLFFTENTLTNIVTFIDYYTDDKGVVELPAFHGCGLKNRNDAKKLVDYRNGNQCLCDVWSDENSKIEYGTYPMTRYMTQGRFRYIYENRENCLWNYKTKKYVHMLDTPASGNFNYFMELKKQHLNSTKAITNAF